MNIRIFFGFCLLLTLAGCSENEPVATPPTTFEGETPVTVVGYTGQMMEPFITRDDKILLFNNPNTDPDTDLHWATYINDSTFEYGGKIAGANSLTLDGVPTMDSRGLLYFVSLREYEEELETIYTTTFANGAVGAVTPVENISKYEPGQVNFDVEINFSGETMYFVDGTYDANGGPYDADLVIAKLVSGRFQRLTSSDQILNTINSDALEYAAGISSDDLQLFFTRAEAPLTSSTIPQILVATRTDKNAVFGVPQVVSSITGFAEAPTISHDGKRLYYHKYVNGGFGLFLTKRSE